MRAVSAEMADAAARGDLVRFGALNRRLHALTTARCPNGYLLELLEQTRLRLDQLRSTVFICLPERSAESTSSVSVGMRAWGGYLPAKIPRLMIAAICR